MTQNKQLIFWFVFSVRMSDLVGIWDVSLSDGLHQVEFEHGTTTGKRVIRIDGKVITEPTSTSFTHRFINQ